MNRKLLVLLFCLICSVSFGQGKQIDFLINGMTNSSGYPLSGGLVYSYYPGTSTPKPLYSDYLLTTPLNNPASLSTFGKLTAFGNGTYKLVLKTSAGATVTTLDGVEYRALAELLATPAVNPFGSTLRQTNLIASYVESVDGQFTTLDILTAPTATYSAATKGYVDDAILTASAAIFADVDGLVASIHVAVFTSGPATFTVPPHVSNVVVSMIGGGGGGGGYSDDGANFGHCGYPGQYIPPTSVAVTPGASITVLVGAAGLPGTNGGAGATGTPGLDGGTSAFGAVSASGGGGGPSSSLATSSTTLGALVAIPSATPFGYPGSPVHGSNSYGHGWGGCGGIKETTASGSVIYWLGNGATGTVVIWW